MINLENHPFLSDTIFRDSHDREYRSYEDNNTTGFIKVPFSSSIYKSHLTIGERMKQKRAIAKKLLKKGLKDETINSIDNTAESRNSENNDIFQFTQSTENHASQHSPSDSFCIKKKRMSKLENIKKFNEVKILRNRIAAQKSRDKKKEENNNIKVLYENLLYQNSLQCNLVNSQREEINFYKNSLSDLCKNCSEKVEGKLSKLNNYQNCELGDSKLKKGDLITGNYNCKSSTTDSHSISNSEQIFVETNLDYDIDMKYEFNNNSQASSVSQLNEFGGVNHSNLFKFGILGSIFLIVCIIGSFFLSSGDIKQDKLNYETYNPHSSKRILHSDKPKSSDGGYNNDLIKTIIELNQDGEAEVSSEDKQINFAASFIKSDTIEGRKQELNTENLPLIYKRYNFDHIDSEIYLNNFLKYFYNKYL